MKQRWLFTIKGPHNSVGLLSRPIASHQCDGIDRGGWVGSLCQKVSWKSELNGPCTNLIDSLNHAAQK